MRMICPNCGQGGTAGDEHYQKNVQCPNCLKVFKAAGQVLVDPAPRSAVMAACPEAGVNRAADVGENAGSGAADNLVSDSENPGITACDVCRFRFNSDFIRIIDGRQICPVCAN